MDQNTVWVIAIAALIVGLLLGFLFGKSGSNGSREIKLADELDSTQAELTRYKDEVNEHFSKTADLVNGLTNQYQKVHEHLASSAEQLCRDEKLVASLQQNAQLNLAPKPSEDEQAEPPTEEAKEAAPSDPSAPLDYAPKNSADEPGTLSDSYGLKEKTEEDLPDPSRVHETAPDNKTTN